MKKLPLSLRLYVKALSAAVNAGVYAAPTFVGKKTVNLFSTPRKGRTKDYQQKLLDSADHQQEISVKSTVFNRSFPIKTYHWEGKGPTVLLLHGWESNTARWKPLLKKLRQANYNIYAIDAPAHGSSGSKFFNLIVYAEAIEAFLKDKELYGVICHSVGCAAFAYYLSHSEETVHAEQTIFLAPPDDMASIFKAFLDFLNLNDRARAAFNNEVKNLAGVPVSYFSTANFMQNYPGNGLVVHSKDDKLVGFSKGDNIRKAWPKAKFLPFEDLGHSLQNKSVFEAVMKQLEQ